MRNPFLHYTITLTITLLGIFLPTLATPPHPAITIGPTTTSNTDNAEPDPETLPTLPGSRILRAFNFEEEKLGNFETIPMYFSRVVGRGFPAYSTGAFDKTTSRKPSEDGTLGASFKLETRGGSVAYRFNPPPDKRIPVFPDADYYIIAFVKTQKLQYARADITAWLADDQGNLLPATEVHSQPYTPTGDTAKTADQWRVLYLYIPGPDHDPAKAGDRARAKSLVFQLGLMQPQQLGESGASANLGKFSIYHQDIAGSVAFDDITVFQLPRVSAAVPATAPGAIFGTHQNVDLDLTVSDLGAAASDLDIRLKIKNSDGLLFANEHYNARTTPQKAWNLRYAHPPLPAGSYTATLEVADARTAGRTGINGAGGTLIARREARFLSMPPNTDSTVGGGRPAPEFGLSIPARRFRSPTAFAELPNLLRQTGVGLVQFPAWRRDMNEDALTRRDPPFDTFVNTLQRLDIRSIATLPEIPEALAERLPPTAADKETMLALLQADPTLWKAYISFTLTRYANRIDYWQVGSPDTPFSGEISSPASQAPELTTRYVSLFDRVFTEIAPLLNRPQALISWNALFDFDPKTYPHAMLDLRLPSVIKPSQIPTYIDSFRQSATASTQPGSATTAELMPLFAHIEPLEERGYTASDRLADFAQRLVYARSANPRGILYDLGSSSRNPSLDRPDEFLLVYRTLTRTIGNATYAGDLPLAPGVHAFLFTRNGLGTLVLWNENATVPEVQIALPLGNAPRQTDLFGSQRTVPVDAASGKATLTVTSAPLIIDNFDPRPVQVQSSFALANQTLPAGAGVIRTDVLLKNPYGEPVSGTLRITPPKGWTTDPSVLHVTLPANQSMRKPITVRYPFTENSGSKAIDGKLTLDAGPNVPSQDLDLRTSALVTSDLVDMEGFTQVLDNGDVSVQLMVTNLSGRPLDAQAYALLPGYPRQQRYLLALPPGQTAIKRFNFAASTFVSDTSKTPTLAEVLSNLSGKTATLGIRQSDGKTLMTRAVPID